uniref:Uncharacterized protein n=1 Tax=Hordeum vulgare subsp. vulgare TaxID=112509 RepID=A0A8I6Z0K5_HORVV
MAGPLISPYSMFTWWAWWHVATYVLAKIPISNFKYILQGEYDVHDIWQEQIRTWLLQQNPVHTLRWDLERERELRGKL